MKNIRGYWASVLASLKIIVRIQPRLLTAMSVRSFLMAVQPFVMIIVSSQVITMLAEGTPIREIVFYATTGLLISFFITAVCAVLYKFCRVRSDDCFRKYEGMTGEKTMSVDFPHLESPKIAELRQRMRDDNNWGAGIYSVLWTFASLIHLACSLVIALAVSVPLLINLSHSSNLLYALVLWTAIVLLITLSVVLNRRAGKKEQENMNNRSKENRLFSFFLDGMDYSVGKDVRIYKAQELFKAAGDKNLAAAGSFYSTVVKATGTAGGTGAAITAIIQGGAYLFVALSAASGLISIGMVVRYAGSIYQFSTALAGLFDEISYLTISSDRQKSTMEYFNIPDILYKGTLPVEKRRDNEYEIEFRSVSFKYPGSESYALYKLNLKLNIGQRMAVVGMNGSGKTTMIKLLCRLYDPTEGEITLNGIDIKKYDYDEYMRIFSVVFQDFKLFSFSLGQNVASSIEVDEERATDCLAKAGLSERYLSMPKGLNTPLYRDFEEDGVEISGGEAQKIALARALYKNAPFIVLDEPTAALDPIAEFEVYSKFNDIVGEKTAIYISHRLSSCRFCDDIAVFHEGELIQRGNHDTLLADESGKYHELWHAQAQYYTEKAV